jgi:hypothetical protein
MVVSIIIFPFFKNVISPASAFSVLRRSCCSMDEATKESFALFGGVGGRPTPHKSKQGS